MRIIFIILILFAPSIYSQTYNADGSIVSKDGTIVRESYAVRYQKALDSYNRGEEVKDWPIVKKNKKGKTFGRDGYFGEGILEVGAPLLAIEKVSNSKGDFIENLAKQNGFVDSTTFNLTLIVNSNADFQKENSISNDDLINMEETYDQLIDLGIIGQDMSEFDNLSDIFQSLPAIDPQTGNATLPNDDISTGVLVNDEDIQIEGVDPGDSLEVIAEKLNLDSSLVTSKAMAETLSSVSSNISNSIPGSAASQAIDPNTGNAPKVPD